MPFEGSHDESDEPFNIFHHSTLEIGPQNWNDLEKIMDEDVLFSDSDSDSDEKLILNQTKNTLINWCHTYNIKL